MNYETAKKLKDAGFPQSLPNFVDADGWNSYRPDLSQLIEACGEELLCIVRDKKEGEWVALGGVYVLELKQDMGGLTYLHQSEKIGKGSTAGEAVANLWLALNKK